MSFKAPVHINELCTLIGKKSRGLSPGVQTNHHQKSAVYTGEEGCTIYDRNTLLSIMVMDAANEYSHAPSVKYIFVVLSSRYLLPPIRH